MADKTLNGDEMLLRHREELPMQHLGEQLMEYRGTQTPYTNQSDELDQRNRLLELMGEPGSAQGISPGMLKPYPGMYKDYLGPQGEDFIRRAMTLGPLSMGHRAGSILGEGAVWAHRASRPNSLDEPAVSPMKAADFGRFRNIERELSSPTQSELAENYMAGPRVGGRNARDYSSEKPYWSARAPDNSNAPMPTEPHLKPVPGLADPNGGRFSRMLEGEPPLKVELKPTSDLVQRYLNALKGTQPKTPKLTIIDGGAP